MTQFKDVQEIDELIDNCSREKWSNKKDDAITELRTYILELQAECMVYESKLRVANKSVTELSEKLHIAEQRTRC